MKKILLLILTCCALCWTSDANAQIAFGFHYHNSQPLGDYKENLHRNPQGVLISTLVKSKKLKNLSFGGEFGLSMYADDNYFYELPDGEFAGDLIEMYEEDCFLTYNGIVRYTFNEESKFSPYVQGTLGAMSFFSTRMSTEEYEDYYESITKFHGTSLMAGLGAGLVYSIHPQIMIDAGAFYNKGTQAEYRSIEPSNASYRRTLDYGRYTSAVNAVSFKVGLLCGF